MSCTAKVPIQYFCTKTLPSGAVLLMSFLPTVHVSSACVAFNLAEQLIKADAGY